MSETRIIFRDINEPIIAALLAIDPTLDAKVGSIFEEGVDADIGAFENNILPFPKGMANVGHDNISE